VVTSRISRSAGAQSFGGAHRARVCVRVFIGVSVCACCEHTSTYGMGGPKREVLSAVLMRGELGGLKW
jgi:hypothetical protein